MRVAVCEKDVETREYLVANLKELELDLEYVEFGDIYDLEEEIEGDANAFDIVCISATMQKKGDGIAIAQKIRTYSMKVTIIIMADSRDFYQEAFDMFAMAYLIKPVQYRELERCFTYYTKNNNADRRASWLVKSKGGNWRRIYCRDIVYIESNNREFIVHMADGEDIESYGKLAEVAEQIASECIIRCHQSYIVNMYYATEMTGTAFVLEDVTIPISRKYIKVAKEQYYKYMFGRM